MGSVDAPIRAGLIFQQAELAARLKQTLIEAGISINAEFDIAALRSADLSAHSVEVYIVNLEPEIEDHLDEVTDLLEDALMPVVFNDAGVSSDLSGWDQARWARHLAAKIRKGRGNLPPMPENAQAIPTPKRAQPDPAIDLPEAVKLETDEPTPTIEATDGPGTPEPIAPETGTNIDEPADQDIVDQSDPNDLRTLGTENFELALADDEVEDAPSGISTDTVAEPTGAVEFESIDEQDLELLDLLGDDEGPEAGSVGGDRDAYASELAAGMSSDNVDTADSELTWQLDAELETPDEDLSFETLSVGGESTAPTLEDAATLAELLAEKPEEDLGSFDTADLGLEDLTVSESDDNLGDEMSPGTDSFSDDLIALETDNDADWDDSEAVLSEINKFAESDFNPPAAEAESDTDFLDQVADFGGLDLDLDVDESRPAGEELVDLDALLAAGSRDQAAEGAQPDTAAPDLDATDLQRRDAHAEPAAPPSTTASLDELANLPDLDSWSLEPLEDEATAPPAVASQTPTKRVQPVPEPSVKADELSLSLDELSLVPLDDDETASSGATSSNANMSLDFLEELSEPVAKAPPTNTSPQPVMTTAPATELAAASASAAGPRKIVVLGASIGGPDSIRSFLSKLNTGLHGAFILVQHMGAEFLDLMAQQLDRVSPLSVHLARHGQQLNEGEVVIAPVGQRLRIDANGNLDLSAESGPTAYSPSIDQVLIDSLDRWGGERLLVIIFSGMASDAVEGSKKLAAAGTPIWAQDPASCVISSMVDGVVAAKVVNFIGSPEQLAEQANRLLA